MDSHPASHDRRVVLVGIASSVVCLALPAMARATPHGDLVEDAVAAILRDRIAEEGGITLSVPSVAENGAQVPVTIRVESPMTSDDHVTTIHVLATRNPTPRVGRFHLTPQIARAEVTTRIRLAEEQEIVVIAEASDGRVFTAAARIAVTVGGCAT